MTVIQLIRELFTQRLNAEVKVRISTDGSEVFTVANIDDVIVCEDGVRIEVREE